VDEVAMDPSALVTGQGEHTFVSLSGQLDILHDPERLHALWKPAWNIWFPNGKDDANAVLMRLRPEIGEYWLHGALKGVRYLFEATRALLDGTTPQDEALEHAKVPMS
jgi:general stress protein 26